MENKYTEFFDSIRPDVEIIKEHEFEYVKEKVREAKILGLSSFGFHKKTLSMFTLQQLKINNCTFFAYDYIKKMYKQVSIHEFYDLQFQKDSSLNIHF